VSQKAFTYKTTEQLIAGAKELGLDDVIEV